MESRPYIQATRDSVAQLPECVRYVLCTSPSAFDSVFVSALP
jgi:hypothetical protein